MIYSLHHACDTLETGPVFPQIEAMRPGYDFNKSNSVHNLNYKQLPDFLPDLDYFILDQKAKLSDVLSNMISPFGLLISRRTKDLLEKFKLPKHGFYPASVVYGDREQDDYFWFLPICKLSDHVDYLKTTFYSKDTFNNIEEQNISSPEELKELGLKIGFSKKIRSDKIYFNRGFKLNLDLFMIGVFDFDIYVSENLKSALINNNISGIIMHPVASLDL